jgi:phage FluMu gp28-like protein
MVRVDEVQVAVAGSSRLVGETLDLAADPQLVIPGKSRGQRRVHLVVEGADRENARALIVLCRIVSRGERRSLGVEELMGTAGHPRHPTEAVCVAGAWVGMAD